jgi:pimeloyl-ACP methyl ester carboxylesterase
MTWHCGARDGVRLACRDYGGQGPPIVLLHGLAGYAEGWAETARGLGEAHRVLALDQRGHGRSERNPEDVSQAAFVCDVEFWLEHFELASATIIGQSLGGLTAFLFAARRPRLIDRLVVAEATPAADPEAPAAVSSWLDQWRQPFASFDDALAFFGDTNWGRTWAGGLDHRDGGYWPGFHADTMIRAITETATSSYWNEWRSIACPTLVVRGETGIPASTLARMLDELPTAEAVTIRSAGHDIHLEQPAQWNQAIHNFI